MTTFRVYRNLHHKNWTVQSNGSGRYLKTFGTNCLWANCVSFRVNETGRDRVRSEGRKNVHAYAVLGKHWTAPDIVPSEVGDRTMITYNPYNEAGFHSDKMWNIQEADDVLFMPDGRIYAGHILPYDS